MSYLLRPTSVGAEERERSFEREKWFEDHYSFLLDRKEY